MPRTASFSIIVTRLPGKSREAKERGNPEPRSFGPQGTFCRVLEPPAKGYRDPPDTAVQINCVTAIDDADPSDLLTK